MIDDSQSVGSGGGGTMPFLLWPQQDVVFDTLLANRLVVILKARQLGISWVVCAYVLWRCLFRPGQLWLLFSRGQSEANEQIRRVKALYDRLPDWMRESLPQVVRPGSVKRVAWQNGSAINSMPAKKGSGVSFTASGVVMDEAAKMQFAEHIYNSAKPTVDQGQGQLVMLSTAEGVGNMFHSIWEKAESGENGFAPVFLPWWARPDRDLEWYAAKLRESHNPKVIRQEYPSTAHEAFLVSGRTRFEPDWVDAMKPGVRLPRSAWPARLSEAPEWPRLPWGKVGPASACPHLVVFKPPEPGRRYVVAADVAEGKDPVGAGDPDYDAAVVADEETLEEVATLHGHWEPDQFGKYLAAVAWAYNLAEVAVERNNHGHAVLATLRLLYYPNVGLGHDGDQGWLTSALTKPQGIDLLAEALRSGVVSVRYPPALHELRYYSVHLNGATSAPAGRHDDLVMAWYVLLSYLRCRNLRPRAGRPVAAGSRYRHSGFLGPGTA